MREAEKKRLVKLIEEAHKKSAEAIHEHIMATLKEKGRFNSKTDADRQSIYEIEADYLLDKGVIVPPCKVDDTIYKIFRDRVVGPYEIRLLEVDSGVLDESGMHFVDNRDCWVFFEEFGKTVFLSKAEAEYALNLGGL